MKEKQARNRVKARKSDKKEEKHNPTHLGKEAY
jgi:hypothetical protein